MLRRYAGANALAAFTRRLRLTNQASLSVCRVEENFAVSLRLRRGAGGVVEATSERRSRGNARGDAPELIALSRLSPRKCSGATLALMRSSHSPGACGSRIEPHLRCAGSTKCLP